MLAAIRVGFILGATIATIATAGACQSATVDALPLDLTVALSRASAAPGDTITMVANAQGGGLLGINIDFGDGAGDSFNTGGARTAKVTFKHVYRTSGTYTVTAAVTDAEAGQKTTSVQVRIN